MAALCAGALYDLRLWVGERWQQQSTHLFLSSLSRPDPHAVVHLCRDQTKADLLALIEYQCYVMLDSVDEQPDTLEGSPLRKAQAVPLYFAQPIRCQTSDAQLAIDLQLSLTHDKLSLDKIVESLYPCLTAEAGQTVSEKPGGLLTLMTPPVQGPTSAPQARPRFVARQGNSWRLFSTLDKRLHNLRSSAKGLGLGTPNQFQSFLALE